MIRKYLKDIEIYESACNEEATASRAGCRESM